MNPRFTVRAKTSLAAVLLLLSPAQAISQRNPVPGNCRNPRPVGIANPNSDMPRNNAVALDREYVTSDGPARSRAAGQKPRCDGEICTYPCPNGDGVCTYTCPTRSGQDGPYRGDGGNHDHGGGGGLLPWIIGGLAIGVGAAVASDQLTGKDWVNSKELDAHGPRFPVEQRIGRFQVQGYASSDWPFALDISTQPGTRTWLEVRFKGDDQSQSVDLTRPEGGRRVEYVRLPAASGGVRVARYSIHSVLERPGQEPQYVPMMIYGIGAGPGAVGVLQAAQTFPNGDGPVWRVASKRSAFALPLAFLQAASVAPAQLAGWLGATGVAAAVQPGSGFGSYLAVTAFGPRNPSRAADVSWTVAARQNFQRSELDILQVPADGNGKLIEILKADLDLFARNQASGNWGGVPVLASVRPGTYQLQARAWRPRGSGGDWTGAFAPDYVYIR